jgi:cytochrome c-type biogenesis protein CcmF
MALGPFSRWKRTPREVYLTSQVPLIILSLLVTVVFSVFYGNSFSFWVVICVFLATCLASGLLLDAYQQVRNKHGGEKFKALFRQTPSYYGMWLAHLGIAVTMMGVCMVSIYSDERDVRMSPGDTVTMGAYEFRLLGVKTHQGPNYTAERGDIEVTRNGNYLLNLHPEKRHYPVARNVMTEAAIDPGLFRDLYVALGEPVGTSGAWAVRVHYKPFVRWVWFGGVMIMFGGFLTVFDRRYRSVRVRQQKPATLDVAPGAVKA